MFRSLIGILFAVLYLILTLPVLGILELTGLKNPEARDRAAEAMIRWSFGVLLGIAGTRITVRGLDNIPDEPVLFVGNHRSIWDIIMTYYYMKRPCGYIAKISMKKIPVFSIWMNLIGCLFLDRSDLRSGMQMMLDAINKIKGGHSMYIFAEGTRNKAKEDLPLLEFHEGSFKIAVKSGCKIVPVAINNSQNIMEAHNPWLKAVPVVVEFLPPIDPSTFDREGKKHLGAYTRDRITEAMERNAALLH
ncbi:MAG: lysophospholipid acyltransferase family protein [Eubacteriales bacterium]|jgi:1-acyl-sn-glycerol-3-phosphate acyltransferase